MSIKHRLASGPINLHMKMAFYEMGDWCSYWAVLIITIWEHWNPVNVKFRLEPRLKI
jgi:hypothetical protein